MTERIVAPRLADIIEAIERIRGVLDGVTLEAFEQNWEKRWLVERGIEIISEASRHLTDDIKERRTEIPWPKVAGIGNVLRHAYDHVAPDVLWKLAQDDLAEIEKVCREELVVAEKRSGIKILIGRAKGRRSNRRQRMRRNRPRPPSLHAKRMR
jgi:uncharacterized protein with HEPN domain